MRYFGSLLAIVGFAWSVIVAWSKPEFTDRELWLNHPVQLGASVGLLMLGAFLALRKGDA